MITCQKPITDIAMELGFCNSSYFTAVFRRFNACTPSEYQKQKAEEHRL
ncbi:MAG: helix-turn-helix transcriptional regulator [Lachnospiraceae bacterium]|nr:helix-turn-helix transcriptional regulator [Lachnospiraceae bacterium]